MSESVLTRRIKTAIEKEFSPSEVFCYKTSDRFTSGIPDLILCVRGLFLALEIKTAKGKVTRLQEITIRKINHAGGISLVVRSVKEAVNAVKELIKKSLFNS